MGWEISEFTCIKNSERRCKLFEFFWVFLRNVPIRIKIRRKIFAKVNIYDPVYTYERSSIICLFSLGLLLIFFPWTLQTSIIFEPLNSINLWVPSDRIFTPAGVFTFHCASWRRSPLSFELHLELQLEVAPDKFELVIHDRNFFFQLRGNIIILKIHRVFIADIITFDSHDQLHINSVYSRVCDPIHSLSSPHSKMTSHRVLGCCVT